MKISKTIQEEIQNMLNEVGKQVLISSMKPKITHGMPVFHVLFMQAMSNTADNSKKRNLSKRCKVLASFVDSMLEENKKPDLCLEVPPEDQSFSVS